MTLELRVELQQSLDKMMERGGFNLTKWASNSKEVLSHIAEQEQAESITTDFNASDLAIVSKTYGENSSPLADIV